MTATARSPFRKNNTQSFVFAIVGLAVVAALAHWYLGPYLGVPLVLIFGLLIAIWRYHHVHPTQRSHRVLMGILISILVALVSGPLFVFWVLRDWQF